VKFRINLLYIKGLCTVFSKQEKVKEEVQNFRLIWGCLCEGYKFDNEFLSQIGVDPNSIYMGKTTLSEVFLCIPLQE